MEYTNEKDANNKGCYTVLQTEPLQLGVGVDMKELPHSDVTGEVLVAAFDVHGVLGTGFLESVYEAALIYELQSRRIHVKSQVDVPIHYKNVQVGTHVLDLRVADKVIVELKAIKELADIHTAIMSLTWPLLDSP